ncbi:MAG: type II toxin-antitoxin system Phd/YefM family antitoxin [Treponema sp.]|jgi:PHD/YefM family antitoxin component YafN of YafNO toxin-antitoxin module|nr:type II toxin-antitoxin system Phd/YefM family antitoxin [Treponema sp.]
MPSIRPISDLRDHFEEIHKEAHEWCEPIFLTKNGYGDMVILSMEAWEAKQFKTDIYHRLIATEAESNPKEEHLSREEIFSSITGPKKRTSSAKAVKKAPPPRKKTPESKS